MYRYMCFETLWLDRVNYQWLLDKVFVTENNHKDGEQKPWTCRNRRGPETLQTEAWMVIDTDMCSSLVELPMADSMDGVSLRSICKTATKAAGCLYPVLQNQVCRAYGSDPALNSCLSVVAIVR